MFLLHSWKPSLGKKQEFFYQKTVKNCYQKPQIFWNNFFKNPFTETSFSINFVILYQTLSIFIPKKYLVLSLLKLKFLNSIFSFGSFFLFYYYCKMLYLQQTFQSTIATTNQQRETVFREKTFLIAFSPIFFFSSLFFSPINSSIFFLFLTFFFAQKNQNFWAFLFGFWSLFSDSKNIYWICFIYGDLLIRNFEFTNGSNYRNSIFEFLFNFIKYSFKITLSSSFIFYPILIISFLLITDSKNSKIQLKANSLVDFSQFKNFILITSFLQIVEFLFDFVTILKILKSQLTNPQLKYVLLAIFILLLFLIQNNNLFDQSQLSNFRKFPSPFNYTILIFFSFLKHWILQYIFFPLLFEFFLWYLWTSLKISRSFLWRIWFFFVVFLYSTFSSSNALFLDSEFFIIPYLLFKLNSRHYDSFLFHSIFLFFFINSFIFLLLLKFK
ncbi:dol-p-glc:glc(2)man(9)glcnac(2)-pp-dol alpha-12-glucosyltransferase-related [Anaeramoeba ignava]|uniref:Dol-P-Glc:Glc(2)Man(9)GlcNAc(2)-PP-Dol alpha-1,2-glucosyltransferase n=1 Tax=Anaeramoeba ignava TaxID=1746090 RepID=A0A9Q0LV14_ANAIG|nr:dol-p-glc:glc(2)man(9)glcnac(2)-pp-dol alpha-12-glucosyltransferase-related [Anaeramoeba ignava]